MTRSSAFASALSHSRSSSEITAGRGPGFTCANRARPSPSDTASQPTLACLRKGSSSFISGTSAHGAVAPFGGARHPGAGRVDELDIVDPRLARISGDWQIDEVFELLDCRGRSADHDG